MASAEGSDFLKKRFNLHASPEVESAAKRTNTRTGEKVAQNPAERIENYLGRFKEIVEREDGEKKELGLRALKKVLHDSSVIKAEDIPESYFVLQQQIAREQGHGTIEITPEMRDESIKVIQEDQRASLNTWIDYLASGDALYPDWAKYWAFRSILGMSLYDKEKKQFGKRSKNTTAPFPDLNREALAYVVDAVEKRAKGEEIANPVQAGQNEFAEEGKLVSDEQFQHMLSTENFAKYYAFAIEHVVADNSELFKTTEGEWKVFKQGSDPLELTKTLQGHGTGWCTAGESTAKNQLKDGDFYVYYSLNAHGIPTIPRLAIRMEEGEIAEVRGVAHEQEIDPYISPVLEEKLGDFGDEGEVYKKKAQQMKLLTQLDKKVETGEEYTRDELLFLYEVNEPIEGFGYGRDPRIEEILKKRNALDDAKIILETHGDDDFIQKFLDADAKLRCRVLGVPVEEGEDIDYDKYDPAIEKFFASHMPEMRNLSAETADRIMEAYLISAVADNIGSFAYKSRLKLLQLLIEYDQSNDTGHFAKMVPNFFKDVSEEERIAFLSTQISQENSAALEHILPQVQNIPTSIAKDLIRVGQEKILAANLKNFQAGLDSQIATQLIGRGYALEVSENLKLFRGLDSEVWEELSARAFYSDLEKNPTSFAIDNEYERNPFGEYVKKGPFRGSK